MALILRGRGIERVRPLAGGFQAWRDRGYPTARVPETTDASSAPAVNTRVRDR